MYNINILSECNDENIRVAIITAVNEMLSNESNFIARRMKRVGATAPVWGVTSRKENLDNRY